MFALDICPGLLVSCAGKEGKAYVAIRVLIDILPFPHLTNTGYLPFAESQNYRHRVGVSDGRRLRMAAFA